MSATIHYRKVGKSDPYLKNVMAPSAFIESMERAFGRFPVELGSQDICALRGMKAMHNGEHNPYTELIEIIERFGLVEVYATY